MKITRHLIDRMDIVQFADAHGLEMEVFERNVPAGWPNRFYARFKDAEVKDGCVLIGAYGDGATEAEAISNYAKKISLARLVIHAYLDTRREITVPLLSHDFIVIREDAKRL